LLERVISVVKDYYDGVGFDDPACAKPVETRNAIVSQLMSAAAILDKQGEVVLAGNVRFFANHLPPVLTDRQRLAVDYVRHTNNIELRQTTAAAHERKREDDLTR
jgi:hypothetical protein